MRGWGVAAVIPTAAKKKSLRKTHRRSRRHPRGRATEFHSQRTRANMLGKREWTLLMTVILRLLVLSPFIVQVRGSNAVSKVSPEVGYLAPDFALPNLDGKTVRLSDYQGKKGVFINFWATWCPPCRLEMPTMEKVYQEYQSQGLEILAVSIDAGLLWQRNGVGRRAANCDLRAGPRQPHSDSGRGQAGAGPAAETGCEAERCLEDPSMTLQTQGRFFDGSAAQHTGFFP